MQDVGVSVASTINRLRQVSSLMIMAINLENREFKFAETRCFLVNIYELSSQSHCASIILLAPQGEAFNCLITIVKKHRQRACWDNQISLILS